MRKFLALSILLCAFGVLAEDYVLADRKLGTNKTLSVTLSNTYTAEPVQVNLVGVDPASGKLDVFWTWQTSDPAVIQTNTIGQITLTNATQTITLNPATPVPYLWKGQAVQLKFTASTSGVVQVMGKLYGQGKK